MDRPQAPTTSNIQTQTYKHANNQKEKSRVISDNPRQHNHSQIHQQDEIYQQPKVMRNSNSHYDTLLDQLYQEQKNANDSKSYTKGKNMREVKNQIHYFKIPDRQHQYLVYCVANKESSTGIVSHQRLIVLDTGKKELKYYSHIPKLPIKSLEDISEEPKEIIKLTQVNNFAIKVGKKGIGELQFSWVDKTEIRLWKLKMANNTMAKEFANFVETIRSGKKVQNKSLDKSRVQGLNISPQHKLLNTSQISSRLKQSNVQASPKNSNFANMLLTSIRQPEQIVKKNPTVSKIVKKQEKEPEHTLRRSSVKEINYKIEVEKPKEEKINESIHKPKLKLQQVEGQVGTQKDSKYQYAMYSPTFPMKLQEKKKESKKEVVKESTFQSPKMIQKPIQLNYLSVSDGLKNQKDRQESINIDEILRVASIQRLQYKSTKPEPKKPATIISSNHDADRLSKLEQIVQKKRQQSMKASSKELLKPQGMDLSKIMVNKNIQKNSSKQLKIDTTFNPSRNDETSTVNPKTNNIKYQTPKHTSNRDDLLDERKYAQTICLKKNSSIKAKVVNQHNHPRRQRGKSNSFSSQIDEYISQQRSSKQWLYRWLTASDQLKRGHLYLKFIQNCKEKVQSLISNSQNWHLFHKPGQKYAIKSQEIEFIYCVSSSHTDVNNSWDELELKMKNLQYLWNCMNELQYQSGQTKIAIPLACIVSYKCFRVFCKVDIEASKIQCQQLNDLSEYEHLVTKLTKKAKTYIKNARVYQLSLNNKQFLYIDQAELRPYIKAMDIYLNKYFMTNNVGEIILTEENFEQISVKIDQNVVPEIIQKLRNNHYLSTIEIDQQLKKFGFDDSLLPFLFNKTTQEQFQKINRYILSYLVAQLMVSQVISLYYSILLSKNQNKNIQEQICTLISKTLRLENDSICQSLLARYQISISLQELKDQIIEQFVICSMLIKLGIRCNVKNKGRIQSLQKRSAYFWRQFQFTESSIEFHFEPNFMTFSAEHFNPHFNFIQQHIFKSQTKKTNMNMNVINSKLNTPLGSKYYESDSFRLLSRYQKQQINSLVAELEIPIQDNRSIWSEQLNNPYFYLFQFTTSYYVSFESFLNVVAGIKWFISKRQYKKAEELIMRQLYRAWIWGKSHCYLLMESYDLLSLVSVFEAKESLSLQSCLISLQIAIKAYENKHITSDIVLQKAYKSATIHSKYGKTVRSIQLFSTCEKALDNISDTSMSISLLKKYLPLYLQKSQQYLKLGELKKAEENLRLTMQKFSTFKEKYHNTNSHLISLIFQQQFQGYFLLFRVFELSCKRIEMLQLMEDCSVKYIENYLEHLFKKKQDNIVFEINDQLRRYFKEILKNVWIAILNNCSQWRVSTYQHYFNYSYAPLRNIELSVIRNVILDIRKAAKGAYSLELEDAINFCFNLVISSLKKYSTKEHMKTKPKSILVVAFIDCLSLLTQHSQFGPNPASKSQQLMLLQSMVACCGYEFTIGAIDSILNNFNTEL